MPLRVGVLADDLSGSLASAAALRALGLNTYVCMSGELADEALTGAEALVVDMATRDSADSAEEVACGWAEKMRKLGAERVELRIDTTLRGRPREELAGLLAGFSLPEALVLAVPAYPRAGRTTLGGRQRVRDPDGGVRELDVNGILFDGGGTGIGLEIVRGGPNRVRDAVIEAASRGARRFFADAESEGDLRTLGRAAALIEAEGRDLVTLSPGAWLRYRDLRPARSRSLVVTVIGSATDVNRAALERFAADEGTRVLDAYTDPALGLAGLDERVENIVVETLTSGAVEDGDGSGPSRRAAVYATALVEGLGEQGIRVVGLVASGGETARHLIDGLGALAIRAEGEAAPLCACGQVAGGSWAGLPIITKGGQIGNADTLIELTYSLHQGVLEEDFERSRN